jgi:hypothetical protein
VADVETDSVVPDGAEECVSFSIERHLSVLCLRMADDIS